LAACARRSELQALGARELEVQIARSLRTHGVRVRVASRAPPQVSAAAQLSRREVEVATLVAQGCTNREIAERLVISERTAETHLQHIFNRLRLRSRTEIATWAIKNHLA
jgi:DNA-binding NarL/FixJ family response regulator